MEFGKSKAFVRLLLFEKRLMLIWNENYKMIKNKERTGLENLEIVSQFSFIFERGEKIEIDLEKKFPLWKIKHWSK